MIAITECAHNDHDLYWNDLLINEIYIYSTWLTWKYIISILFENCWNFNDNSEFYQNAWFCQTMRTIFSTVNCGVAFFASKNMVVYTNKEWNILYGKHMVIKMQLQIQYGMKNLRKKNMK